MASGSTKTSLSRVPLFTVIQLLVVVHVCQTAPTANDLEIPTKLCSAIGKAFTKSYSMKQTTCGAMADYKLTLGSSVTITPPGPNSIACGELSKIISNSQPTVSWWKANLAYQGGVLDILVNQGYIRKTHKLEARINRRPNNPFLLVFPEIATESQDVLKAIVNLAAQLPDTTIQQLSPTTWVDICPIDFIRYITPVGQWPPTSAINSSPKGLKILRYQQSLYNYGTLSATCNIMEKLVETLSRALDNVCPSHLHPTTTASKLG